MGKSYELFFTENEDLPKVTLAQILYHPTNPKLYLLHVLYSHETDITRVD